MDRLVSFTLPSTQNPENNVLDDMHREAETNALRKIQAKLEKSENLEKLDQLSAAAATQRKRTLDEQLRTTMQSQLESIKTDIAQLQISLDNMKTVERTMCETDEKLQKITSLQSKLEDLRHEADTYRQLSLVQAKLDYFIKTPENMKKADELMEQEKLFQAHQLIMEIENSRNYLLFELHKVQEKDSQSDDIQLVTNYFADYERLIAHLRQLISFRILRWYDCAISAPEKLVTALRIIEREEQVDRFWIEKKELTDFSVPDRPRQWKKLCFQLLRKSVKDRIEGTQLETREEHRYWLTRHLEMCRKILLRDFEIITKTCLCCFPKQYDIVNRFLDYYHNCLKEYLTEICDPKRHSEDDSLTTVEIYAILTFVRDYQSPKCLGRSELNLDLSQLSPLLEKDILAAVTNVFLNERTQKFTEWIPNIISLEVKDWYALKEVELISENYYATSMPRILINMIIETLDLAKQMSDEICQLILGMILQKINEFCDLYMIEINTYTKRYSTDRHSFKKMFIKQMIANANNCESIPNFMLVVRRYDRDALDDLSRSSQKQLDRYENIGKNFECTAKYCCDIILQEIERETSKFLKILFTREWFGLKAKPCCETIIETTRDYWRSELIHLKKPLLADLFYTWHKRILAHYLRNLFSRSTPIKFATPAERRLCAEQLRKEASILDKEFKSRDGTSVDNATEYHFNILTNITDVLEQTDLDSIVLEIAILAKKYPSLNMDQVTQILSLRGDLTKQEARDKADAALANILPVDQGILFELMKIVKQLN